ncbi:hypothetical protein B0H16DRAFT_761983 [Mycena metata]|uniref:Uncharacterized protein n=1 Tax=Mycena metata TaxID=1033252 RepID=A0AAD7J135_9AGAR|nr:hypothetical protein B0H16DRAFT_761983 [Mycena metata]
MDATMDDAEMQESFSEPADDESHRSMKQPPPPQPTLPIDQQRLSLYILTQRDRPIPSLEDMKKFLDSPEDSEARIDELNKYYEEDLQRLYMAQAEDYLDELEDRYYAFDEKLLPDDDLRALYADLRVEPHPQFTWEWNLARTTSVHQSRLAEYFPRSVEEYNSRTKDIRHRIARFLVLESEEQKEKILSEFGWTWKQVNPLQNEFHKNLDFQEQVRAIVIELNVADPRRR